MTLYLLMALEHGAVTLPSGRVFYFARYIDWSITTPLLLLSLVSGAVAGHVRKRGALIAGLILSDEESGSLPMGLPAKAQPTTSSALTIGTRGGRVKPSSGYAFQRINVKVV